MGASLSPHGGRGGEFGLECAWSPCNYVVMRSRDTSDVLLSLVAVVCDGLAVFGGLLLATWVRFDSGWFAIVVPPPPNYYHQYALGATAAVLGFLLVFRSGRLYVRPQVGRFTDKIPRIVRSCGIGIVLTAVMAFALQNEIDFARLVIGIALFTTVAFVLLERWILYRIEWNLARHAGHKARVLILGTDAVAAHLRRSIEKEPMLRSKVIGYLRTTMAEPDAGIEPRLIQGSIEELAALIGTRAIDRIILTDASLGHDRVVQILLLCERNLIEFQMVPDLFRIMTSSMDVQSLNDIPLLGVSKWPLDFFWNRLVKRLEDVVGGAVGLLLSAPVLAVAALVIKRTSPGPIFFSQERCGEHGRPFTLYKLRTMRADAEAATGPVWARPNDDRRTRIGAYLRERNIDELPQFWNVLRGDMSLVGPRPERPHFVEKFKEDIGRYMWRHVSKPGLTGWAQVNGLRGDTSLEERIRYDLYYLENWSLSFDFKILMRTVLARENAY